MLAKNDQWILIITVKETEGSSLKISIIFE